MEFGDNSLNLQLEISKSEDSRLGEIYSQHLFHRLLSPHNLDQISWALDAAGDAVATLHALVNGGQQLTMY